MPGQPHETETLAEGPDEPEADASPEPALGGLFAGRYRIECCIGRGSMGTVYAAHDHTVEERVALKLLATPSTRALERFRREVRLARKVTHRNAARTFDLGEHAGACFITMELVEGESLRLRLAREQRMTAADVGEIARQLALGLQAAHDVGVIHRDLKPANVLIDPSGRAVITDFGVAFSTAADPEPGEPGTHERPPMGGTPAYMAPEQVLGLPQDARTDLYALGVMLYELLTGQTPWRGGNHVEVAMARLHLPVPDPRSQAPVPDGLAEVVLACMSREPERRPQSAKELVARLAASRPATVPTAHPGPTDVEGEGSSSRSSFAPTTLGEPSLAVLPFRFRGPPDDAYLAEALGDELIDLLAMTRGLRVSASGATARFAAERDARAVGRELGVHSVIDGTVQRIGDELRIVTRLIDVETGFQRWSERFTGDLEDVFELQDRMAKRIAEALRVELVLEEHRAGTPREAVEHYLRGRSVARDNEVTGTALELALDSFARARAAAPAFALPVAAIADATVRRWFVARHTDSEQWAEAARVAVADALREAPGLAETHLAAARLDVNRGDFRAAALHLEAALQIAPTFAAAHEYLGMLQCDTGRSQEGARHILLAHELDPTLGMGGVAVLRHHALQREDDRFEALLARLRERPGMPRFATDLFEFRIALWRGQVERARAVRWPIEHGSSVLAVVGPLRMVLDETVTDADLLARLDLMCEHTGSPRLRTTWRQVTAELLGWRGAKALAFQALTKADAENGLFDADWVERCPLLDGAREVEGFDEIAARVRARANGIWVGRGRGG